MGNMRTDYRMEEDLRRLDEAVRREEQREADAQKKAEENQPTAVTERQLTRN